MQEGEKGPVDKFAQFLDRNKVILFGIGVGSLIFSWYMTIRMSNDIKTLKEDLARLKARRKKPWYEATAATAGLRKGKVHVLGYRRKKRA